VNEHKVEISPHPIYNIATPARYVWYDHNVSNRAQYSRSGRARTRRFDQRFNLEAKRAPPERKCLDYDGVGPRRGEGGKQRIPTSFLQFFVDRPAVRPNEISEGRIEGSDRWELNNARGFRKNWPLERLSTRDYRNLDAFARNCIGKPESALYVPYTEQVLNVKQDGGFHRISQKQRAWTGPHRHPSDQRSVFIIVSRTTIMTDCIDHRCKSTSRSREIMLDENTLSCRFCERRPLSAIEDRTTHRLSKGKGVSGCDE
jgi:hypothetical protein